MIKKKFLLILTNILLLVAFILGVISLSACGDPEKPNYKGLYFGKYYLNDSGESYLEITDDITIKFVNVDFTCIDPESYWGESALWQYAPDEINVTANMQGDKSYAYNQQLQVLSIAVVEVSEGLALSLGFKYNGIDQLKLNKVEFDYIFTLEQK